MYYPKSKIISDLYTDGTELIFFNSGISYTGYYHILANNKIYSGKNPNDGVPQLLVFNKDKNPKGDEAYVYDSQGNELYDFSTSSTIYDSIRLSNSIQPPKSTLLEPKYFTPIADYPSFIRYFVRRTNNSVFIEINKDTYTKLLGKDKNWNWAIYIPFEMPWTTGGANRNEIAKINKDMVLLTEQRLKLYGFSNYITNYTEFAI